jgi:hypothetical protein
MVTVYMLYLCIRDKRFDAEREKKVYQSLWININVDHKIREVSQKLRSMNLYFSFSRMAFICAYLIVIALFTYPLGEALGGVDQYMEKITKLLQAKHQQQFEKDYFKNEKLSKTFNKGGEKLAFLKHSAMSQLKGNFLYTYPLVTHISNIARPKDF